MEAIKENVLQETISSAISNNKEVKLYVFLNDIGSGCFKVKNWHHH